VAGVIIDSNDTEIMRGSETLTAVTVPATAAKTKDYDA